MFFNSFEFIFAFLPLALAGLFLLGRARRQTPVLGWLILTSLVYYGWQQPSHLILLLGSCLFNYLVGLRLGALRSQGRSRLGRLLLTLAVAVNLALLGYYKYADFLMHNLDHILGWSPDTLATAWPLGISFITFQQIAYLVDVHRADEPESNPTSFLLFITFFPKILAGPIVRGHELLPQLERPGLGRLDHQAMALGLALFLVGLFKKSVMADGLAPYVRQVFDPAVQGIIPNFGRSWLSVLAYTLQIYYDFSGYSDMALGLARMVGIRLPFNFDSPYKSRNIVEFWRRWHISLSRFLRDYIYIPLGGNRHGPSRRYVNLLLTMLLGGLWHGAGWTFVIWGGLHGLFLCVNHLWHKFRGGRSSSARRPSRWGGWAARLLTFTAVSLAWVFFRAADLSSALVVFKGMLAMGEKVLPDDLPTYLFALAWRLGVAWFLPNSQEYVLGATGQGNLNEDWAAGGPWWRWRPSLPHLGFVLLLAILALGGLASGVKEFLYYQF